MFRVVIGAAAGALLLVVRRRTAVASRSSGGCLLEVCTDSLAGTLAAEAGGAGRVELCAGLVEGGLTPSVGTMLCCRRRCGIPIHCMLRPRAGDFLYDLNEQQIIFADLDALKAAGADGFVVGVLGPDGLVDEPLLTRLVAAASPLPVTFHRAIDVTPDPVAALRACARCGVARVLSSGGAGSAPEGVGALQRMAALGDSVGVEVAAGGGLNQDNIGELIRTTGVRQVHGSARELVRSRMSYRPSQPVHMGGEKLNTAESEFEWKCADKAKVASMVAATKLDN